MKKRKDTLKNGNCLGNHMAETVKGFYDVLMQNIKKTAGAYYDIIKFSPVLFKLLCRLYADKEIRGYEHWLISSAIAYFVVPVDIISEAQYGSAGYIDDIFLAAFAINRVMKTKRTIVLDYWAEKEDLTELIRFILRKTRQILKKEKMLDILKYADVLTEEDVRARRDITNEDS